MAAGSFMMVHNPYAEMLSGDAKRLANMAAALAVIETRYAKAYARSSGQPEAKVRADDGPGNLAAGH